MSAFTEMHPIRTRATEVPYPAPAVGWYSTVVLALLYWLSLLDRFIIALLVDPIQRDLGLTDVQFGMLHGIAFLGSFTLFGLVFGALADRVNRRRLIYVGVTIWSIATATCGVAQNFWHLLIARVGVGVGEASLNPSATSMIADLFPRAKLTTAMAVYALGSTVGNGTALIIGGAIVDLVSHMDVIALPIIGNIRPWQAVFVIVGVPGALFALSIFTVPEPVRRNQRGTGVAVFTTVMGLLGGSAGPLLIAVASQFGGQSIGVGLAVMIAICCPAGALFLLLGLGAMREAMAEAERVEPVSASHTGARSEMSSSS